MVAFELVDQEYGDIGYATGNLICQPTSSGPITRVRVDDVSRVLELTTPKCSTLGCGAWATHTLETDNCDPLQDLLGVDGAQDPVCEPCGTEYVHTNRIKRLTGVLTEGTA
ncbi:hypothetical protein SMALB_6183 [Streptomyces malaysiensis]|uniref:Uncharacterized protein n=1 Tax=Streptomyces malaysiensis TaxID=92644 RepID=A0A7X5X7J9_STRMQ|nr:hypothetical protein [Streptomyces malaysiensis]